MCCKRPTQCRTWTRLRPARRHGSRLGTRGSTSRLDAVGAAIMPLPASSCSIVASCTSYRAGQMWQSTAAGQRSARLVGNGTTGIGRPVLWRVQYEVHSRVVDCRVFFGDKVTRSHPSLRGSGYHQSFGCQNQSVATPQATTRCWAIFLADMVSPSAVQVLRGARTQTRLRTHMTTSRQTINNISCHGDAQCAAPRPGGNPAGGCPARITIVCDRQQQVCQGWQGHPPILRQVGIFTACCTMAHSTTTTRGIVGIVPIIPFPPSVHYHRIHPAYWRDRLLRLKSMGLNAIQVGTSRWQANAHHTRAVSCAVGVARATLWRIHV